MKKKVYLSAAAALLLLLIGCGGPSEEKLTQISQACEAMTGARQEAAALAGELEDEDFTRLCTELDEAADALLNVDYAELKAEEIEEELASIQEVTGRYEALLEKMQEALDTRGPEQVEIRATLVNSTGGSIKELYLYEDNAPDKGDNLMGSMEPIGEGVTLLGVRFTLELEKVKAQTYTLEAVREEGDPLLFAGLDLGKGVEEELMITLGYDEEDGAAAQVR